MSQSSQLAASKESNHHDPVSNVLKWTLLFIAIACFIALAWGTIKTYKLAPPLPQQFLTASGKVIMTDKDIVAGKADFQRADLMDYGSLYGMGSYFGADFTAKYLVRLGQLAEEDIAQQRFDDSFAELSESEQYVVHKEMQKSLQQIDLASTSTTLSKPITKAVNELQKEIVKSLLNHDFAAGWTKGYSLDPENALQTADFLIYSAFTTIAHRPGKDFSYTNNWPYEPSMGNTPTSATFSWTWLSFCFAFFGFGVVLYIYQRYLSDADKAPKTRSLLKFKPLTSSQIKVGQYFITVALVLLAQIVLGALMAHDYSAPTGFYGSKIAAFLPFNFLRDVHTQTPIVWIGLSWISAGIFLAPIISGKETKGQGLLVDVLFWLTLFIAVGALIGNYLDVMGFISKSWIWIGNQGLSYLQLGRLWQIGFCAGLFLWSFIVLRGMWPTWNSLKTAVKEFLTGHIRLEHLFWVSVINIAILYCFGVMPLTGVDKSFLMTDFWRWGVVHLWVEQSFEFFAVCSTAYLLMGLGLVSRKLAERTVYFVTILIFLSGILGTVHHLGLTGVQGMWVPLGSMFSFIEILPLALLIFEAIGERRKIKKQPDFKYNLAYLYLMGAVLWNFVGAGIFGGGTFNAPLVNYYEHGTFLSLNHAHTALFGAFGLLALGLVYFCLRFAAGEKASWSNRLGTWAFWLYNVGLVLWIILNFFSAGWSQLMDVYAHGLAHARSLGFYNTTLLWQWLHLSGDVIFAVGALLMAYDFVLKLQPFFPKMANGQLKGFSLKSAVLRKIKR